MSEYINILEVAAILLVHTAQGCNRICALPYGKVPLRRGRASPVIRKHYGSSSEEEAEASANFYNEKFHTLKSGPELRRCQATGLALPCIKQYP